MSQIVSPKTCIAIVGHQIAKTSWSAKGLLVGQQTDLTSSKSADPFLE